MSGMSDLADREGFLVLYPGGTGLLSRRFLTWNSGNCCGRAMRKSVDDSGFLAALIERYEKDGSADPKRVFVTGLSNGAMMAFRLACERADLVAAIAPVAGAIGVPRCEPSRPVSVLMIHGRADRHVPYDGGRGSEQFAPRTDRSVAEDLALWTRADACAGAPATSEKDGVRDEDREQCRDGTAVRLISHPGGHVWPGGRPGLRFGNADPVVPEPKATETIWDFFKSHPREK
jgi:polyhydroxybutyrate depolymerase